MSKQVRSRWIRRWFAVVWIIALIGGPGCASPDRYYIVNARIWTGETNRPHETVCAVRDGRFVYVGDSADEAAARIGVDPSSPGDRRMDARGAVIIPGLIDAHLHLISGGLQLSRLNLREAPDRAAFIEAIAERARRTPTGRWILGGRWSTESWPDPAQPTRHWIDPVTSDHPVLLSRMDGHGALANSVALRLAGIDAAGPPDPPGGAIERDPATGEPTGILKDTAIDLVAELVPDPTDAENDAALDAAMAEAHRHGITCVHTLSPYKELAVVDRARSAGRLTLRVRYYISEDDWRDYLERAAAHDDDALVRVCGFKQYADGSLGSRTAWMAEPYSDTSADHAEARGLPRDVIRSRQGGRTHLQALCEAADAARFDCAVHAIGDQANHEVLNVYERVAAGRGSRTMGSPLRRSSGPPGGRLRIEHAQHLLPDDIARFGRLGVVASMQPYHKADDGRYAESVIGARRCRTSYAFRSLLDAGARLAFGSDWPVVSINPWRGIHAAVTGRTLDGRVFVPEQNITVEEALRAYTRGAAFAAGDGQLLGRIAPGLLADFVILEDDPFSMPEEGLGSMRVRATYVGGKRVWPGD